MVTEILLDAAFLRGGVERVSWWNGRVLTAEDLRDLQEATEQVDRRLGRAIGTGVVGGLHVSIEPDGDGVRIAPGTAVTPAGEVLVLSTDEPVSVPLVTAPLNLLTRPALRVGGDFARCTDVPTPTARAGAGTYLLTIGAATGTRGTAAGTDHGTAAEQCGPRHEVAGVRFRLVGVDLHQLAETADHPDDDLEVLEGSGPLLRNVTANVLMDGVPRARSTLDPFGDAGSFTPALERLRAAGKLADDEVPLAVVRWGTKGIDFVDTWAARRPPLHRPAAWLAARVGNDAVHDGLVTLLQFADHLADVVRAPRGADHPPLLSEYFRYVPPAALLPIAGENGQPGLDLPYQLDSTTHRQQRRTVAAGRVWPLLRASLTAAPLRLSPEGDVPLPVQLYIVPEAAQEVEAGRARPYLVMAANHLRPIIVEPDRTEEG